MTATDNRANATRVSLRTPEGLLVWHHVSPEQVPGMTVAAVGHGFTLLGCDPDYCPGFDADNRCRCES